MTTFTTTEVEKGRTYRFRYRAKNVHGWGPFSDELYVIAASVPAAPPSPTVLAVSATQIQLQLYPSQDNGGTAVTDYQLHMNTGVDGSTLSQVASYVYSSNGFTVTMVVATESMTAGLTYEFAFRAVNSVGTSDFSGIVAYTVADKPAAPAAPSKSDPDSTRTSITILWTSSADTQLPGGAITGYYVYMDDG